MEVFILGGYRNRILRVNLSHRSFTEETLPQDLIHNFIGGRGFGARLLYDALESGKLDLNDLAPGIKELRAKQDELSKARVIAEAEMTLQGYQQLDLDAVRSYVVDPWNILDESEVAQRKAFLRSFVKKIVVEKERVKLYYNLPVPPDGRKTDTVRVLPIDTPSGPWGTVPELLFEKKGLIPAVQELIVSHRT